MYFIAQQTLVVLGFTKNQIREKKALAFAMGNGFDLTFFIWRHYFCSPSIYLSSYILVVKLLRASAMKRGRLLMVEWPATGRGNLRRRSTQRVGLMLHVRKIAGSAF